MSSPPTRKRTTHGPAFYEAIEEPSPDIIVLRDTVPAQTILAPSKEDISTTRAPREGRWLPFAIGTATGGAAFEKKWDASLRDRATLLSPPRSLAPAGEYPNTSWCYIEAPMPTGSSCQSGSEADSGIGAPSPPTRRHHEIASDNRHYRK